MRQSPRSAPVRVTNRETPRMDVRDTPAKKQRLRKGIASSSPTFIPREMIPPDVDLQWVTDSIHGAPDVQGRQAYEINGWEPVLGHMFDGRFDGMFAPKGHAGEINVYGQVLMWRPMELTLEARAEESRDARNARTAIETKLRNGQLDGVSFDTRHPTARAVTSIAHERVSLPVPE